MSELHDINYNLIYAYSFLRGLNTHYTLKPMRIIVLFPGVEDNDTNLFISLVSQDGIALFPTNHQIE